MKVTTEYKGFRLEVAREKCMGGWEMKYLTAVRESDGLVLSYMEDSEETNSMYFDILRLRVDETIEEEAAQATREGE